ncbi:MAG TPA: ABC transporter substrate-binding protein [Pirellulaceae bacterium]|nr:ABC transporter substrate-binding protein [Pirellulaceae bacterium]
MDRIAIAVLRGVCQLPAYVAKETGLFEAEGIAARLEVLPTAWVVPERLLRGEFQFAVMPWTRVATASSRGEDLVLVCGSGYEEAAIVVRQGLALDDVQSIAVPQEGGIKDLTAHGLMQSLGWDDRQKLRLPSGDGAILALVGQGADAASMVEPYASMLEALGIGTIVRSTGDLWPGAPGCSLATTRRLIEAQPDLVRRTVAAFASGAEAVRRRPDSAAAIGAAYIGVHADFIRRALARNQPRIDALFNDRAQEQILEVMQELGYVDSRPADYLELGFLREVACAPAAA